MAKTIDDIVNGKKQSNPAQHKASSIGDYTNVSPTLQDRLNSLGSAVKFTGKALFTGALIYSTYGLVGLSSILTSVGNGVGYLIEKVKGKEKINKDELNKEVATGSILGVVGYSFYSLIDIIPNYNFPLKILKTVAFNPIMLAPYVAFYQAFTYLRDKVGVAKTALGLLNFRIFKYLKDAYYNEVKPNFKKGIKKVMYLMPIHFASINYVTTIWKRVGIGVFNDIVFRLFQSKKADKGYAIIKDSYRVPSYGTLKHTYS